MSYYCLVSPAFTGHLNPMTILGRELQRRGHRVLVVCPLDGPTKVLKAGLEFCPMATTEFPECEWELTAARIGELSGLRASRFVGYWLGNLARGILRDLPGIAARERFDGLVMDQTCFGCESVCAAVGLPLAVACCALAFHTELRVPPAIFPWRYRPSLPFRLRNFAGLVLAYSTGWPVTRELVRYRRQHRLPAPTLHHLNEMPPSLVQVAQQPAVFDFPRRHLPDHFHYTGPWKQEESAENADFPWNRLDGRPLVYASMGTLQNRLPHVFQIIADVCARLQMQLVMPLGREDASLPGPLPGEPIVVGYAPQLALLRRAKLVITSGGLNTSFDSLARGLPLVVVPVAHDQPGIATRLAYLGVGEFIPVQKLTVAALRQTVQRVLAGPSYRESAARLATQLKSLNGPATAADLLESAFASRQRIKRLPPAAPRQNVRLPANAQA